jgi:ubiquinone/menaquinone biosynthesis C-methylase UbiE
MTQVINEHQKSKYGNCEKGDAENLIIKYEFVLEKVKSNTEINILDIGGASGHFAVGLYNYFYGKNCKITVIDATQYDTREEYSDKIIFRKESVNNLNRLYTNEYFDLIFVNRAFHHFVATTWDETIRNITDIMRQISILIKKDGYLCIADHFYNGLFFDVSASKMIYKLTSCKIPLIVKIFRSIDANSAGVGVCFLSKIMWYKIFEKNNLDVIYIKEGHRLKRNGLKMLIYRICLLIKDTQLNTIIVLKRRIGEPVIKIV